MVDYGMLDYGFIAYLAARVCISLAGAMLSVTIGWHLYQHSGNPFDLALVGLMQILPMLSLFILTGWVIDHFSRKTILVICAMLDAVVFAGLALSMQHGDFNKLIIFFLLFLHGCSQAFYSPALQAILPNIVSRELLSRAVAVTTAAWTTASTTGPFIAGLMIAWIDYDTYWILVVLSILAGMFFLFLPVLPAGRSADRDLQHLLSGIHFVRANPIVLPSITLDMFIVLFGGVMALLPVYAIDVLKVGPEVLGTLRAMPALGAVMMGIVLTRLVPLRNAGKLLFISFVVFTFAVFLFAVSKTLWLSLLALWIYGASDMVSMNIRSTLIQLATPDDLRGRVSAVNMLFIYTSNELGDFRAGSVAALIGPVATVVTGSVMALVVAVAGYWRFTELRQLDRVTDVSPQE